MDPETPDDAFGQLYAGYRGGEKEQTILEKILGKGMKTPDRNLSRLRSVSVLDFSEVGGWIRRTPQNRGALRAVGLQQSHCHDRPSNLFCK